MTNIIRPNFGSREAEPSAAPDPHVEYKTLHVYGTAAGYFVALMEEARSPEARYLTVVIGSAGKTLIEAVAVMPPTDEGRVDADLAAMAVLRAPEIVEQGSALSPVESASQNSRTLAVPVPKMTAQREFCERHSGCHLGSLDRRPTGGHSP